MTTRILSWGGGLFISVQRVLISLNILGAVSAGAAYGGQESRGCLAIQIGEKIVIAGSTGVAAIAAIDDPAAQATTIEFLGSHGWTFERNTPAPGGMIIRACLKDHTFHDAHEVAHDFDLLPCSVRHLVLCRVDFLNSSVVGIRRLSHLRTVSFIQTRRTGAILAEVLHLSSLTKVYYGRNDTEDRLVLSKKDKGKWGLEQTTKQFDDFYSMYRERMRLSPLRWDFYCESMNLFNKLLEEINMYIDDMNYIYFHEPMLEFMLLLSPCFLNDGERQYYYPSPPWTHSLGKKLLPSIRDYRKNYKFPLIKYFTPEDLEMQTSGRYIDKLIPYPAPPPTFRPGSSLFQRYVMTQQRSLCP